MQDEGCAESVPQGLKPTDFADLTARLKSSPFKAVALCKFFRKLGSRAPFKAVALCEFFREL
jgi:hypothetical protein